MMYSWRKKKCTEKTNPGEHRLDEIASFQIKQHCVIALTYCGCEIDFPIGAHAKLRVYPFASRENKEVFPDGEA